MKYYNAQGSIGCRPLGVQRLANYRNPAYLSLMHSSPRLLQQTPAASFPSTMVHANSNGPKSLHRHARSLSNRQILSSTPLVMVMLMNRRHRPNPSMRRTYPRISYTPDHLSHRLYLPIRYLDGKYPTMRMDGALNRYVSL